VVIIHVGVLRYFLRAVLVRVLQGVNLINMGRVSKFNGPTKIVHSQIPFEYYEYLLDNVGYDSISKHIAKLIISDIDLKKQEKLNSNNNNDKNVTNISMELNVVEEEIVKGEIVNKFQNFFDNAQSLIQPLIDRKEYFKIQEVLGHLSKFRNWLLGAASSIRPTKDQPVRSFNPFEIERQKSLNNLKEFHWKQEKTARINEGNEQKKIIVYDATLTAVTVYDPLILNPKCVVRTIKNI
jgi:hypothetical protein